MPNNASWIYNEDGLAQPFIHWGLCNTGVPLAVGDICTFKGGTYWAALAANESMAGVIAICLSEIRSGDPIGYYPFIVPRKGDIFRYALDAASALTHNASLYYSTSQQVTTTAGSGNVLGYSAGYDNYPRQKPVRSGGSDQGTTVRSVSYANMRFKQAVSYEAAIRQ